MSEKGWKMKLNIPLIFKFIAENYVYACNEQLEALSLRVSSNTKQEEEHI